MVAAILYEMLVQRQQQPIQTRKSNSSSSKYSCALIAHQQACDSWSVSTQHAQNMDLSKLTQGLACLKSGLDDLDSQCTQHAAKCMQLRQQVLQEQRHRKGLEQQAATATAELHERQEQVEDLTEVFQAVKGQAAAAQSHKGQLQVRACCFLAISNCTTGCWQADTRGHSCMQAGVKALQVEVETLVSSLESDSSSFSSRFGTAAMQQQELNLQQEEAAAEEAVAALMQALLDKRQSLTQQQAAAKDAKQQVVNSQAAVVSVKQLIAAESAASTALMSQLQEAEADGPAAKQLPQVKQELTGREDGLLQQKCRWVDLCGEGAVDHSLSRSDQVHVCRLCPPAVAATPACLLFCACCVGMSQAGRAGGDTGQPAAGRQAGTPGHCEKGGDHNTAPSTTRHTEAH